MDETWRGMSRGDHVRSELGASCASGATPCSSAHRTVVSGGRPGLVELHHSACSEA